MKLRFLLLFIFIASFMKAQTVVDIVVNSEDHTILETAVIEADLAGTLSGDGPFTLFAPTDDAFEALPAGTIDALLADTTGALANILTYHAVGAEAFSGDLSDGQILTTLNGQDITVTINMDGVFINDAQVTMADIDATNGVVHVINAVLIPGPRSVFEIVENSDVHNTLEAAINAAGLDETLSDMDGTFTLFAPTDAAFNALPEGTVEALLEDPMGALTNILLYHAVGAEALSSDLSDGQVIMTLNGQDVTVTINDDGVFINDAQVIIADLESDNGVVHVIDAVLLPGPKSVFEIVENSDVHNTLEVAIEAAGLDAVLSDPDGSFTLFAPTDAAFDALPEGTVEALLADPMGALTDILLYHAVGGEARSTDLSDGQRIETINGRDIIVSINDDGVFINGAQVIIADLESDNGVVHVIDAVLLPPPPTVADIVEESDVHNTLEVALDAADLTTALATTQGITLFAPTDAAFNLLPEGTIEALLADIPTLQAILLHHVSPDSIASSDLSDGLIGTALTDLDFRITLRNDSAFVDNIYISVADIEASNGIVHVIDGIMIPTTTASVIANSAGFENLTASLQVTGLLGTLNASDTRTTLFAPTDAAFQAIPEDILDLLANDIDGRLTGALLYHVVEGRAFSSDLSDGQMLQTVLGEFAEVTINNDGVFINDAQVLLADFFTGNGVIHVIDAVLLPAPLTVMDVVIRSEAHTTLQAAIEAAGLDETLQGEGPFTLFAPTDDAFGLLPEGTVEALLEEPEGQLTDILLYHALSGTVFSSDLSDGQTAATINGAEINISITDGTVTINDMAEVIIADIATTNGVVHVLNMVLLPPVNTTDVSIEEAKIFPSPAISNFTIDYNEDLFSNPTMAIVDNSGRIVRLIPNVQDNASIDVSSLAQGLYSIVLSDNQYRLVQRLTKM